MWNDALLIADILINLKLKFSKNKVSSHKFSEKPSCGRVEPIQSCMNLGAYAHQDYSSKANYYKNIMIVHSMQKKYF